jgi:hypothetical protein
MNKLYIYIEREREREREGEGTREHKRNGQTTKME